MIGVMWAKGSRPLKGKRYVVCAFDERKRGSHECRSSFLTRRFLLILPAASGLPGHFGLSVELGQDAEAVGKGGEGRGRRKATAAGVGERRMT